MQIAVLHGEKRPAASESHSSSSSLTVTAFSCSDGHTVHAERKKAGHVWWEWIHTNAFLTKGVLFRISLDVWLVRPGTAARCWSIRWSDVESASADPDNMLPEKEEEQAKSISGADQHDATSTCPLCSSDPRVSRHLYQVITSNKLLWFTIRFTTSLDSQYPIKKIRMMPNQLLYWSSKCFVFAYIKQGLMKSLSLYLLALLYKIPRFWEMMRARRKKRRKGWRLTASGTFWLTVGRSQWEVGHKWCNYCANTMTLIYKAII